MRGLLGWLKPGDGKSIAAVNGKEVKDPFNFGSLEELFRESSTLMAADRIEVDEYGVRSLYREDGSLIGIVGKHLWEAIETEAFGEG